MTPLGVWGKSPVDSGGDYSLIKVIKMWFLGF